MSATEKYFNSVQQYGPIESIHPVTVGNVGMVGAQQDAANAPAFFTPHTTSAHTHMQGSELLASAAMADCPAMCELINEHRTTQEALQIVHQSMNLILSGSKGMYIDAREVQAALNEMSRQVERFKQARKLNPSLPSAQLRAAITPIVHRYKQHFNTHQHGGHTHDPHTEEKPKKHIHADGHEHHGTVSSQDLHYSMAGPSEYM